MQRLGTTTPASRRSTLAPGKGENPARRARCCCPVTAGPPCCAACYLFPRGSSTRQPRFALFFFILSPPFPPPQRLLVGASPKPSPLLPTPLLCGWVLGEPFPSLESPAPYGFSLGRGGGRWGWGGVGGSSSLIEAPRCLGRAPVLPDPA